MAVLGLFGVICQPLGGSWPGCRSFLLAFFVFPKKLTLLPGILRFVFFVCFVFFLPGDSRLLAQKSPRRPAASAAKRPSAWRGELKAG